MKLQYNRRSTVITHFLNKSQVRLLFDNEKIYRYLFFFAKTILPCFFLYWDSTIMNRDKCLYSFAGLNCFQTLACKLQRNKQKALCIVSWSNLFVKVSKWIENTVLNWDDKVTAPCDKLPWVACRALEILVVFTTTFKWEGTCLMKVKQSLAWYV